MKKKFVFVLAALVAACPARAADTAYSLYAAGRYDDAIKSGVAENDAQGFSVAARAVLADETTRPVRCLPCLRRAEAYARDAIAADARWPDGQTYLAVSLGYEARLVGPVVARFYNYPGHAKDALDAALSADPKDPWALAALGGWNIEIVRVGGAALAGLIYGASVEKGLDDFAQAFRIAPDNVAIRYQYALSLSGYDPNRFKPEIENAFARVARDTPQTAYERIAQKRAAELADLLAKGDRGRFDRQVRAYQGYEP